MVICVLQHCSFMIDFSWFHDNMTRNTAEALLLANGVEGTYLLRRSKNNPGMYTVSVRYDVQHVHCVQK